MSILILPDSMVKRKNSIQTERGFILGYPVNVPDNNQINKFPFRYEITTLNVKCHFEILEVFSKTEDNLCNSNNIITIMHYSCAELDSCCPAQHEFNGILPGCWSSGAG